MTHNCVNCGAPLAQVDGKPHLRCEHCASLWFPPESAEGVRTLHEPTEHGCPVCSVQLTAGQVEGQPVAHCAACKGILTTTRALYEIVSLRRRRERGPAIPERPADARDLSRLIVCPSCGGEMSVHPYYGPGNAVIDSCGDCLLVWLDHTELTVITTTAA